MDGPQHYREAQDAMRYAYSGESSDPALDMAAAQVHATLALAAATADAFTHESDAWLAVGAFEKAGRR